MENKEDITRLTIDVPTSVHKELKAMCALHSISMREIMLMCIDKVIEQLKNDHR
jgi:hypothetical protein